MKIFAGWATEFVQSLSVFTSRFSTEMTHFVFPWIGTAITIYFLWKAWNVLYGTSRDTLPSLVLECVKLWLVAFVALDAGNFMQYVVEPIRSLENSLSEVVYNASYGNAGTAWGAIDNFWFAGVEGLSKLASRLSQFVPSMFGGSITVFSVYLLTLCCYAFTLVSVTFAAVSTLLINEILLIVVLGFGPLFLCGLMFPVTRGFFMSWFRTCVTFIFTIVTIGALLSMFSPTIIQVLNRLAMFENNGEIKVSEFVLVAMTIMAMLYALSTCFKLIPSAVAGLCNGIALQAVGLGQMLAPMIAPMKNIAKLTPIGKTASVANKAISKASGRTQANISNERLQRALNCANQAMKSDKKV